MPRRIVVTVALTALVVLAGCSGAGTGGTDAGGVDAGDGGRTINVGASGEVQAEPDQAVLRIPIEATGDTAAVARQRLAENVSQMRSALSEIGVDDDQVTTVYYDINRDREHERRESEKPEVTYRARHVFEITLSEPGRAGEVIDTAVGNGATGVDDVRFTLSAETRHQLRQKALSKAMDNARGKARVLATGANLSITGVGSVSTTDLRVSRHREVMVAAAGGDGGTDIDSGPVTVTAQVVVTYNATAT